MCIDQAHKWWKASELINAGDGALYVGYEATARLSELTKIYPQMFEIKYEGRFRLARLKFEDGRQWYVKLPKDLQLVFRKYYKKESN